MPNKKDKIATESILKNVLDERFDAFEKKIDKKFDAFEDKIDRKFGVFIELLNDQFSRLIEAVQVIVDTRTEAIPGIEKKVGEIDTRLSVVERIIC